MSTYLDRTQTLYGNNFIKNIEDKVILVIGLGGVGGTALNALMRSGFKKFIIVDSDVVDASNLNRQIMYEDKDIGRNKVEVCEERIHAISKDIYVEKLNVFIDENNLSYFDGKQIDFIVDAIDKIPSKISIIKYAMNRNIPFVVSLGMGKRSDPHQVTLTTLNKTENDPLAKKLRLECKKLDIDLKKIDVVFSNETPVSSGKEIASSIMVPSTAGLLICQKIINYYK